MGQCLSEISLVFKLKTIEKICYYVNHKPWSRGIYLDFLSSSSETASPSFLGALLSRAAENPSQPLKYVSSLCSIHILLGLQPRHAGVSVHWVRNGGRGSLFARSSASLLERRGSSSRTSSSITTLFILCAREYLEKSQTIDLICVCRVGNG